MKIPPQESNQKRHAEAVKRWGKHAEEIRCLYLETRWTQQKIADKFSVTLHAMQKIMKRLGIPSRRRGCVRGVENPNYKHGRDRRWYRQLIFKDKCATCPATDNLLIHHKNFDHYDDRLENLQVLCDSCHTRLHKLEYWRRRKELSLAFPIPRSALGTFKKKTEDV